MMHDPKCDRCLWIMLSVLCTRYADHWYLPSALAVVWEWSPDGWRRGREIQELGRRLRAIPSRLPASKQGPQPAPVPVLSDDALTVLFHNLNKWEEKYRGQRQA
jgi:hypothetical protein